MRCTSIFAIFAVLLFASAPTGAQQQPLQTAASVEAAAKEAEAAGRLRDAFDLYVRAVQALPDPGPLDDDVRLRERIIALASRIEPRPVVPEDAVRLQVRGQVLFKDAKDEKGFEEAAAELRRAVRAAPWAVDFAYNLSLVQEKLEYYRAAAANLKLYVASAAASGEADVVRAKIYELELRLEKNKAATWKEDCGAGTLNACRSLSTEYKRKAQDEKEWFHSEGEFVELWYRYGRKACDGGELDACGELGSDMVPRVIHNSLSRAARRTPNDVTHGDWAEADGLLAKSCYAKSTTNRTAFFCRQKALMNEVAWAANKRFKEIVKQDYQRACTLGDKSACKK